VAEASLRLSFASALRSPGIAGRHSLDAGFLIPVKLSGSAAVISMTGFWGALAADCVTGIHCELQRPITANNPFKGRQYPGEVIVLSVRW
jgi:hypothetical protein